MNKSQLTALKNLVMAIPGMDLENEASIQYDEPPARDTHRTHFRFISNRGLSDNHNGDIFSRFMLDQGVKVEQRYRKLVVIENTALATVFKV